MNSICSVHFSNVSYLEETLFETSDSLLDTNITEFIICPKFHNKILFGKKKRKKFLKLEENMEENVKMNEYDFSIYLL